MLAVRTILHPTDFSEPSDYALGLACALTRDYGARLVVLHVVPPPPAFAAEGIVPPLTGEVRAEAEDHLRRLRLPHADVRAERHLGEGDAATEILRVAREVGADLVVLGTHGRTGVRRLLMGSMAEQVVRRADCPVVTVTSPVVLPPDSGTLSTQTV